MYKLNLKLYSKQESITNSRKTSQPTARHPPSVSHCPAALQTVTVQSILSPENIEILPVCLGQGEGGREDDVVTLLLHFHLFFR